MSKTSFDANGVKALYKVSFACQLAPVALYQRPFPNLVLA